MASNANDYLIYHLDQDGALVDKYDHTDGRATCAIDSINIVLAMLKTDRVKYALRQMTEEYCESREPFAWESWFLQIEKGTREEKIDNVVARFLKLFLIPVFPTVLISDHLTPNVLGGVGRPVWEEYYLLISERMQLNGARLQMMLDLKMRLNSTEDKEGHIFNAYRIIQFKLVDTILHELGHMYISYLGKGVWDSPRNPGGRRGESGIRLTSLVWGGGVLLRRDIMVNDSDYGDAVFLKKQDGEEANQWFGVTKEAVDSTLDLKFQFPFGKGCITKLERGALPDVPLMGLDEEHPDLRADWTYPALHDEWPERRDRIDPEWEERFKKQDRIIKEAWEAWDRESE